MKVKTSELTGAALDWAVAKGKGRLYAWIRDPLRPGTSIKDIDFDEVGVLMVYEPGNKRCPYIPWSPSTDWSQGGPIIERENMHVGPRAGYRPVGVQWTAEVPGTRYSGPTVLITAMRCYVASQFGDEVDIPKELL